MSYEQVAYRELKAWQQEMMKNPSLFNRLSKRLQTKINSYIPEKIHRAITTAIKQMIRGVLFGARYTTKKTASIHSLAETEAEVQQLITTYKRTASVEGGLTGAGGILLGLADFPILLGIKLKMLFDIATVYGFDVRDYRERLYILHIFGLAFSSQERRQQVYGQMTDWDVQKEKLPDDIHQFEWRNFQQEYRDYIDLAKMAQLIPGIGAVVGVVVNYKLIKNLGRTAMNAYRMRLFKST
ncbi:MAG TPA: EcsC family protein [Chitinophagaceae bacterium]|nr:EcsC family protein [Chitinophagaceae bacterium]